MAKAYQAWHYPTAIIQWLAAGAPIRTEEEVASILQICRACPYYEPADAESGKCGICGCGCSAARSPLRNKPRMATEHCPDNPARW